MNGKRRAAMASRTTAGATARVLLLASALLSFALSVFLYFGGNETAGVFVAIWVPSILALGAFVAPRGEAPHSEHPSQSEHRSSRS
jgi:hypothetical protein